MSGRDEKSLIERFLHENVLYLGLTRNHEQSSSGSRIASRNDCAGEGGRRDR